MPLLEASISEPDVKSSFMSSFADLFLSSYSETDPVIVVCILIIALCFCLVVVTVLAIFIHRIVSQYKQDKTEVLKEKYELLLTGIIFDDQNETVEVKRKKLVQYFRTNYLKSTFSKRVLRKEILTLHRSFSGSSGDILRALYIELDLHKAAMKQLSSTNWSEKADAVRELSQLQIIEAEKKILKLTSHENRILRLEAQAAMLSLSEENPFGFLAETTVEMTEWQQLNLEELAKRMELQKIPNFSQWFELSNLSVVQFCIKMTVAYNQFESAEALIKLLDRKDERIVKESVKAIGTLMIEEASGTLIGKFLMVSGEIQEEIIVALSKIGGEKAIAFFRVLLLTEHKGLVFAVVKALSTMGSEGMQVLDEVASGNNSWLNAAINHVKDKRIS